MSTTRVTIYFNSGPTKHVLDCVRLIEVSIETTSQNVLIQSWSISKKKTMLFSILVVYVSRD